MLNERKPLMHMCTFLVILASNVNVIQCKLWDLRQKVKHLGRRGVVGWGGGWRCAHLPRLLLYESTCSPSYLLPFNVSTAAAIFPCLLVLSHIRSKNGE